MIAILAECPVCHRKQATKNRLCSCGEDLVKAKRTKNKVRYWITYRLPGGKQRKEFVSCSIEEAKDAEGKRRGQKRENRIFEMLPEAKITFEELAAWYLDLTSVKSLTSFDRVATCLNNFNKVFGNHLVSTIRPVDVENYQETRLGQGVGPRTVEMEKDYVKTMINRAFDNDLVDGRAVKALKRVKSKLRRGGNARDRILSIEEYKRLLDGASPHLKPILIMSINTGMRVGEILHLQWVHVDWERGLICLPADMTKEKRPKRIPMNSHVKTALKSLPRAVHHDFVFTYKGHPIERNIWGAMKTACDRAGIVYGRNKKGGFTFHDIRSTVKTNMMRAGIEKTLRDIILGHSLEDMDIYYMKPTDEDLHRAMGQYTNWLDEQLASASVAQNVAQDQ